MAAKKQARGRGRPRNKRNGVQYSLYLSAGLNDRITAMAHEQRISRNALLVTLIKAGLETTDEQKEKTNGTGA